MRFAILLSLTFFFACSIKTTFTQVKSGQILTPNIKIIAQDGSFELQSGQTFSITDDMTNHNNQFCFSEDIKNDYGVALVDGAKKVWVLAGAKPDTLHGVLFFSRVIQLEGKESYFTHQIILYENIIQDAMAGKLTYQGVVVDAPLVKENCFGWALWLANYAFYNQ